MDISIIMPVYNSEQYLYKAIDSILNQSYDNFELILIDDGSTDKSPVICEYYKSIDSRVKVIHQSNKGISSARNAGLDVASGEYIMFADNDDKYMPNIIRDNLQLLKLNNCDIVKFSIKYITINEQLIEKNSDKFVLKNKVYDQKQIVQYYDELRNKGIFTFVWNMIVKKSIIDRYKIRFDESIRYGGEDNVFNYKIFKRVKLMVCNSKKYYVHYRRINFSTATKYSLDKISSSIIISKEEMNLIKDMKINESLWKLYCIEYLTFIILLIFDRRNQNKYCNKINILKKIKSYEQFSMRWSINDWVWLLKKRFKYTIIALLYTMNFYLVLNCLTFIKRKE